MKTNNESTGSGLLKRLVLLYIILTGAMIFVLSSDTGAHWIKPVFSTPKIRFGVIADPHFYNPELGMEGQAFEKISAGEIKLFQYSWQLLQAALKEMVKAKVDFIIVPGDLTKDGEFNSHLKLAEYLEELRQMGIPSYVIPGNHDISNPGARGYPKTGPEPVQTITPWQFAHIYRNFGYMEAVSKDLYSLSYVAEPVPGLWLLAIDSCKYRENKEKSVTGGAISPETMTWLNTILLQAESANKAVIGFMHHSIIENFAGHAELLPQFIVEDHETVSRFLAESGLHLMFTGHTHVQDITAKSWNGIDYLLDIQTGSLLTYPHPYRIITVKSGAVGIHSRFIEDIPGDFGNDGFQEYSRTFFESSAGRLAREYGLFGFLEDLAVNAYAAHVQGDELPGTKTLQAISDLKSSSFPLLKSLGHYLDAVWTDLPPADNNIKIFLPQLYFMGVPGP